MKRHQRFVEFYDVRNAAKALAEMNGKEIHGKQIVIEFSRPGGLSKKNSKFSASTSSTTRLNFVNNFSPRPSRMIMPQSPTPPPPSPSPPPTTFQSSSERRPSYYSKGNPKGGNCEKRSSSSIKNSMASLSVNDGNSNTASAADGKPSNSKKNGRKSGNHVVINPSGTPKQFQHLNLQQQQQQQQQTNKGNNKPWKGSSRQSKEYDPRFLINEDAVTESNCRDSRTTVMIKNIPNKYRF